VEHPHGIRRLLLAGEQELSIFDLKSRHGRTRVHHNPDLTGVPNLNYTNFINAAQLPVSFAPGLTWGADSNMPTSYTMSYLLNVQRSSAPTPRSRSVTRVIRAASWII